MRKIVFAYGLIAGLIVAGLMWATWPLHENNMLDMANGMLIGYTTMVIALSLVFFGVKSYRDQHLKGSITFGKALATGLLITLVATILYASSWEVLFNTVANDFVEVYSDSYIKKLQAEGAAMQTIEEAKKEMASFATMYANPALRFLITMTEILPVGVLISLISAALLRKKEFLPSH